ncbi:unnamed protein product, partial [Bubo scandiacus]
EEIQFVTSSKIVWIRSFDTYQKYLVCSTGDRTDESGTWVHSCRNPSQPKPMALGQQSRRLFVNSCYILHLPCK